MGEATDRKVTEIAETRRRLETDLRELEGLLPAPLRSSKAVAGLLLGGGAFAALILGKRRRSRRPNGAPTAEVVVRIVRDDV